MEFDSSKIIGLDKLKGLEGMELRCTESRLKEALNLKIPKREPFLIFCGRSGNVKKAKFLDILPNAQVRESSPEEGMKFIQGFSELGYRYRVEWRMQDDTIEAATLFTIDSPEKVNIGNTQPKESKSASLNGTIRKYCKNKWAGNYRQQEYCIEQETEAMFKIGKFSNEFKDHTKKEAILLKCMHKWREGDGFNYRQAVYCTEKEIEAFERLYE